MTTKHLHRWRKYRDDIYFCSWPTCYQKYKITDLTGKLAKCPLCQRDFIIYPGKFDPDSMTLNCPDCKIVNHELTVDGAIAQLHLLVKDEAQAAIRAKFLELSRRENEIQKQERFLEDKARLLKGLEEQIRDRSEKSLIRIENKKLHILEMAKRQRARLLEARKTKESKVKKVKEPIQPDIGDLILGKVTEELNFKVEE